MQSDFSSIHSPGSIYRLTLRRLEHSEKDREATPEEVETVKQKAVELSQVLKKEADTPTTWLSPVPITGERLIVTGPLARELNTLFLNVSHETGNELYEALRAKRLLDILI